MKVVGIDLAGKPENETGFCYLSDNGAQTIILHTDMEILREIESLKPDIIAIDAPFWVPKVGMWRPCEEKLIKRGFQPISTVFPSMKMLVMRAAHLVRVLKSRGYKTIEVFTKASEKILGLQKEYRKNQNEYDALVAALTGKAYLEGKYENLDGIILPKYS